MSRSTTNGYESLTTVQQELLRIVADAGPITGPALRDAFERSDNVVYQNLPALTGRDLVASEGVDGRTNEYRLTEYGRQVLRDHAAAVAEACGFRLVPAGGESA
ncbi:helix-turn-helix transcriptional regulator [Haloplanus ruber]|uniref:Helix-turn-helix transcriptional regulator n=1 Tax=Haloplanus ruber TaxID=869892 RepID=A0ABD6CZK2_9EURY|nr:helix-turn-helix transcriptional regulator [Haloplanus ruber]